MWVGQRPPLNRPESVERIGDVVAPLQLEGSGAEGAMVDEHQYFWQVVRQDGRSEGEYLKLVSVNDPLPPPFSGFAVLEVMLQGAPAIREWTEGRVLVRIDHTQESLKDSPPC